MTTCHRTFPPGTRLPSLARVVKMLRSANEAYDGPGTVSLELWDDRVSFGITSVDVAESAGNWHAGAEHIPGNGAAFDAVGAARRLLSDARAAIVKPEPEPQHKPESLKPFDD